MSKRPDLGLDAGSVVTRVALAERGHEPLIISHESGSGGRKAAVAAALRAATKNGDADRGRICVAVPDSWLDGEIAGAKQHEVMRAAIESDPRSDRVCWVGQMSAVAAIGAAITAGTTTAGTTTAGTTTAGTTTTGQGGGDSYLVCDAGGTGIRAGLFSVCDRAVQQLKIAETSGGGCTDFDAAIRAVLGAKLPQAALWFTAAATQASRAAMLLRLAATDESVREAPVYERAGLTVELTAGLLLDAFQPTAQRLRSAITTVLAGATPLATLLVGGLAWFPLVTDVIHEFVATPPENLGPEAAVKGALAFASGQAQLAAVSYPEVGLPAHEIRAGLLTQTRLPLPWPPAPGESAVTLTLDSDDLVVDVAGTIRTVHVPGLVPGPYRISIRPGGKGRALLVLRPDYGPSETVLIGPLDLE